MRNFPIAASALCVFVTVSLNAGSIADSSPVAGTWHGTLSSHAHPDESVPATLVINKDLDAKLTGAVNLLSRCIKDVTLEVTVDGRNVVLAGTDDDGDTLTLRGMLDDSGASLSMTYILNSSASGRCETDQGAGTLKKR